MKYLFLIALIVIAAISSYRMYRTPYGIEVNDDFQAVFYIWWISCLSAGFGLILMARSYFE